MKLRTLVAATLGNLFGFWISTVALAQSQPDAANAPAAPESAAEAPSAAVPVATPAPTCVIPAGYMLVPIPDSPAAQAGAGAELGPVELPYQEGDAIPRGYHLVEHTRRGLIIAGSIVTGVPWALGVTAATGNDFEDGTGFLVLPAIGPWLALTGDVARDRCAPTGECTDKAGVRAILVFDGLVQAAGATMFIIGMVAPRIRLIRQDTPVSFIPTQIGREGYGLTAVGSF